MRGQAGSSRLQPYVPRLLIDWLSTYPDSNHQRVTGSLAFADISGFTKLTERLARKGKVGAEEMSDALNATFGELLGVAAADGADLVKWGGDAVLLLFQGSQHADRACRAAHRMRATLRDVGRLHTTSGLVTLRMSVGIHSGDFDFFLVGDPELHRELIISGPAASRAAEMEAAAQAGEIMVSAETAELLDRVVLGSPTQSGGSLLRRLPSLPDQARVARQRIPTDLSTAIPVPIRQHLLEGRGEPEHRAIAVAFVAFSGTDRLMREQGPEAVAAGLDELVRNVALATASLDVTFFESDINVDGGKIMLTAGAPVSAGHDSERMLRTARLIMDRAGVLPIRIGVNRGRVFAGDFGPRFRRTYSVKGDAINLAARVMAKSVPGQVLATAATVSDSATIFETEVIPPFLVKGKSGLVHALSVGAVTGVRPDAHQENLLVGRAHEMDILRAALDGTRAPRGHLVEIVGEPGIGKSRLLEELVSGATDITILSASCNEYDSSSPYQPFRTLLRNLLGIPLRTKLEPAIGRLRDRVEANAPHLLPWLPLLGIPLDLPILGTRETAELDEQFRKRRLEEVTAEFLDCVLPTPTLISFDDSQHMDEASADLLARLSEDLPSRPWLVVVTRRDVAAGFVPQPGSNLTSLRPVPLTPDESLRLIESAMDADPLPRPAMAALAAKAGGNPMFLESLVTTASRSGSVADLPESIEALVTSQIDRLPPRDRMLLRYASVLGMTFAIDQLSSLLADSEATADASTVRRLHAFLEAEDGQRAAFRHALVRDVAYEGLPYRRRQQLHNHVGLTLEQSEFPDAESELLSLHFFHANRFDKAWLYSRKAGLRARAKYANREAIDFFQRAAESARRTPDGTVSAPELGTVLEQLGDAWFLVGAPDEAADAYRQARRHLRSDPVLAAGIVMKEARIEDRLRKLPQSLRRLARGLRALEGTEGRPAHSARSLLKVRYAATLMNQRRLEDALWWADQAELEATTAADKAMLALAFQTLHRIYALLGRPPDLPYGELALQAYTELDDYTNQAHCLNNLAVQAAGLNDWTGSASTLRRAGEIFRRIGDTANEGNAVSNEAEILVRQGRIAEAEPLLHDALLTARAVKDRELVALVIRESGRAAARSGSFDASRRLLEESRQLFVELHESDELPTTDTDVAETKLLQGDFDAALADATVLLGTGEVDPTLAARLRRIRGFALLALGRPGSGAEFQAGLADSIEQDDRYEQALNSLGLAESSSDPMAAERYRSAAQAILQELGVIAVALPRRDGVLT